MHTHIKYIIYDINMLLIKLLISVCYLSNYLLYVILFMSHYYMLFIKLLIRFINNNLLINYY